MAELRYCVGCGERNNNKQVAAVVMVWREGRKENKGGCNSMMVTSAPLTRKSHVCLNSHDQQNMWLVTLSFLPPSQTPFPWWVIAFISSSLWVLTLLLWQSKLCHLKGRHRELQRSPPRSPRLNQLHGHPGVNRPSELLLQNAHILHLQSANEPMIMQPKPPKSVDRKGNFRRSHYRKQRRPLVENRILMVWPRFTKKCNKSRTLIPFPLRRYILGLHPSCSFGVLVTLANLAWGPTSLENLASQREALGLMSRLRKEPLGAKVPVWKLQQPEDYTLY